MWKKNLLMTSPLKNEQSTLMLFQSCIGQFTLHRQTATDPFVGFCQISGLPMSASVGVGVSDYFSHVESAFVMSWNV